MLTYTERRNLYGNLTNDTSATNLDLGDTLMNQEEKRIVNLRAWPFTQRLFTTTTVANQQYYNLPAKYRKLIQNPTVNAGSILYIPAETPDRTTWDDLNSVPIESDIPQWFFIFNRTLGFWPTPSTTGQTIQFPYEAQPTPLTIADYTTGSIVSIANGATTVTGTGTVWTSAMVGRMIRITADDSITSGDGEFYEIASVTSNTVLELAIPYEGATIASATQSYTIGQVSVLPEGYELIPVYRACITYFTKTTEAQKAAQYKDAHGELVAQLEKDQSTKTSNVAIEESSDLRNPNLFVRQ